VLGIIPARAGSKRVPRKNVRLLGGVPLVVRAMQLAERCPSLSDIVVSSDDAEVIALAQQQKSPFVVRRPPELATDTAPAIDYVTHALRVLERDRGRARYDATCILQPSSPLTLPEDVEGTLALFADTGAACAVSVMKLDHAIHPLKLKRMEGDRLLPFLEPERGRMAAHELPELFVRNCAVYVTRRDVIDAGRVVDEESVGYVMPRERSVDINDEMDMAFAEFLHSRLGRS
jgi:CMP-N,N'-diacetyllegionaminic acid synthase